VLENNSDLLDEQINLLTNKSQSLGEVIKMDEHSKVLQEQMKGSIMKHL